MNPEFYTVGHSTRPVHEFATMLTEAGVELVVDVRSFPRSRTNPDYNLETLHTHLAPFSIGYEHLPELGGRGGAPSCAWKRCGGVVIAASSPTISSMTGGQSSI